MFRQILLPGIASLVLVACEPSQQPSSPGSDIIRGAGDAPLEYHFTAAGKQAAVVLSPRGSWPAAGQRQEWVLRVVDEDGLPVATATVEITMTSPVAQPPEQFYITGATYQGDGFYALKELGFAHAGRWHLDMIIAWEGRDGTLQKDHVQLAIDVTEGS